MEGVPCIAETDLFGEASGMLPIRIGFCPVFFPTAKPRQADASEPTPPVVASHQGRRKQNEDLEHGENAEGWSRSCACSWVRLFKP